MATKEALVLAEELDGIRRELSDRLDNYLDANRPLKRFDVANPVSMKVCSLRSDVANLRKGYVPRHKLDSFSREAKQGLWMMNYMLTKAGF